MSVTAPSGCGTVSQAIHASHGFKQMLITSQHTLSSAKTFLVLGHYQREKAPSASARSLRTMPNFFAMGSCKTTFCMSCLKGTQASTFGMREMASTARSALRIMSSLRSTYNRAQDLNLEPVLNMVPGPCLLSICC